MLAQASAVISGLTRSESRRLDRSNPAVPSEEAEMIFAVPVVGEILAGLASSQASAASATQKIGAEKSRSLAGVAGPGDFAQVVDNLDRAPGAKSAQPSIFTAAKT